jgi:hypothetical protein
VAGLRGCAGESGRRALPVEAAEAEAAVLAETGTQLAVDEVVDAALEALKRTLLVGLGQAAGLDGRVELVLDVLDKRGLEAVDGLVLGLGDLGQALTGVEPAAELRLGQAEVAGRGVEPVKERVRSGEAVAQGGRPEERKSSDWSRCLSCSPSAFVSRPAATAASMRSLKAFLSAALSLLGATPRLLAASFTIAWLSSLGDGRVSFVAAIPAPVPPTTTKAAAPAIAFLLIAIASPFRVVIRVESSSRT